MTAPILEVKHLTQVFGRGPSAVRAVNNVSFEVMPGETLGIVGESGSGKTTLGRAIVGLYQPTVGQILYRGQNVEVLGQQKRRKTKRELQMVFQDPGASLDPRMSVSKIVAEGLLIAGNRRDLSNRVNEALKSVGLDPALGNRFPHELSGGQRQRVGIARALIMEPKLLVLDEPISALDVSIAAQVINLLVELKETHGLTYVFIAHDLAMVRHVSDRIAVMQNGEIVEMGAAHQIFTDPRHDFTKALLAAAPVPDPDASPRP
ncbi:MAG: ATP-binding cassette domain-containing protein [Cellulomonadaceae bacterium]|jgi:ABC-type oligopeptide transport system ATPase subunit|nr:ATP-binding cassette domain-containing protein [Cellulomonadaceae bacterium]